MKLTQLLKKFTYVRYKVVQLFGQSTTSRESVGSVVMFSNTGQLRIFIPLSFLSVNRMFLAFFL